MTLIIAIDKKGDASICIDIAHAVHADGKGHAGVVVAMKKSAIINVSKKLGLVTTSSTETEIVSNRERSPKCT